MNITSAKIVKPIIASLISKIVPNACNNPTISLANKKIQFNAITNPTKDNIQCHLGGSFTLVLSITRTDNMHPMKALMNILKVGRNPFTISLLVHVYIHTIAIIITYKP